METIQSSSKASPSGNDEPITLASAVHWLIELDDEPVRHRWIEQCVARFPTDELISFLKAESERYFAINSHTSLRLAEALVESARLADRSDAHALGMLSRADALRILGRYQESVDSYEEARCAFLTLGDEVGWARTFSGWMHLANYLGRGTEALAAVGPAYDTLARHRQWLFAARLDQNTALVYLWMGRYNEALRHYERAQKTFESLGPIGEEGSARAKANRAEILTLLGDFRAALALHEDARQVYRRRGITLMSHRNDVYIADVYMSQGDYTRGLHLYRDAFTAMERDGQEADAAWTALKIVECYLSLNRNIEALELAEETVTRFERCGSPTLAAKARFACAMGHARLGNNEQALDLLDEAAQTFAATNLATDFSNAMLQRARLYLGDENWPAAIEAVEQARVLFAEHSVIVYQMQADLIYARALLGVGEAAFAEDAARSVLATVRAHGLLWLASEGNHILADAARARGDVRQALVECQAAIASIEQVQSRLAVELRGNFLADKLQVYHDAIDYSLRLSDPQSAFAFLERAKSRALVDYLTSHPDVRLRVRDAENQELAEELTRLRAEHDWFYNRLYGYDITSRPDDAPVKIEAESLQAAIREREKHIARILEQLALQHAEGQVAVTEALSLRTDQDQMLPPLDERTVLLEYYFHDHGSAVFIVSSRGLEVVDLDATPHAIRQLLHRWQLNLDATAKTLATQAPLTGLARNAQGILGALYRLLIEPVAASLAASACERLVIVPYGPAHAIPFHALFDGHRYLLESLEVISCPSSSLLRLCEVHAQQEQAEQGALVMACSDGGRLPFVVEEAKAVAAHFPGACFLEELATRAALRASAPRYGIVHLVAHGEARLDNPTFAHLRLADGQLNPADIFNLQLNGALVTLSACETGRGVVMGGDELIGLSRSFLHAGAATLVQSLWRVEDGSTADLMERFYQGLRNGRSSGGALREAQLALLADRERGVHPYFWAPFQLIGASGPLENGG